MAPDDFTAEFDAAPPPHGGRSVGTLLADLVNQTGLLIRQEIALFRAELGENLSRAGAGAIALAVGAMLAFSGWLVLLAAAVLALALVLAAWLAALIVGVVTVAIGGIVLYVGRRRLNGMLVPQRSLRSLREDGAWVKERFR